jgi:hypothetical protein
MYKSTLDGSARISALFCNNLIVDKTKKVTEGMKNNPSATFTFMAHFNNGGKALGSEVYEGSLGNLIAQFFREGKWVPNPEQWKDAHSNE